MIQTLDKLHFGALPGTAMRLANEKEHGAKAISMWRLHPLAVQSLADIRIARRLLQMATASWQDYRDT